MILLHRFCKWLTCQQRGDETVDEADKDCMGLAEARKALDPDQPTLDGIRALERALKASPPQGDNSLEWIVAALEWLNVVTQQSAHVIEAFDVTAITRPLARELPKHGNSTVWALSAFTNAALCVTAPGHDVLTDRELANTVARAAYELRTAIKNPTEPTKNADAASANELVKFALSVSAAKPRQHFIKLKPRRRDARMTVADLSAKLGALEYTEKEEVALVPRFGGPRADGRFFAGEFGRTAQDTRHAWKRVGRAALSTIVVSIFFFLGLAYTAWDKNLDVDSVRELSFGQLGRGLEAGSVINAELGLLAVIATLGVAFAVAPSERGTKADAAESTWRALGTAVAMGCAAVAAALSGVFLVSSSLAPADEWEPTSMAGSAGLALLALILSSSISAWQYPTGYSRWTQTKGWNATEVRMMRAQDYAHGRKLDEKLGRRTRWALTIFLLLLVNALFVIVVPKPWTASWPISELLIRGALIVMFFSLLMGLPMLANFYSLKEIYATKVEAQSSVVPEYSIPIVMVMGLPVLALTAAIELFSTETSRIQEQWTYVWIIASCLVSLLFTVILIIGGQMRPVPDLYLRAIQDVKGRQAKRLRGMS